MPTPLANGNYTYTSKSGTVNTGTKEAIMAQYQAESTAGASPIPTTQTPTVISSKDLAGQFNSNSTALDGKVPPPPVPGATDTKNPDGTNKTPVEVGASKGAGTDAEPNITTGNPILDSLQAWEKDQDTKAQADAALKKEQITGMLKTNLAANDATYAAQIQSITNTYSNLIDTQTRINNLSINRTKAYGLANGGALATPLEFTNAVVGKEQEALSAIQKLDNERDALIGQAKAAQATGDAKLLQDSMDAIDKVESNMKSTMADLSKQVTDRATLLQNVETQQRADQAAQAAKLISAAIAQYGTQYGAMTDDKQKDALVKQIVAQSGGLLDYGSVYAQMEAAKTAAATASTKALQDKADLAKTKAQTNQSNASAAVDWAKAANGGNPSDPTATFYAKANKLLTMTDEKGVPYMDNNKYITPEGWGKLVDAAAESKVSKTDLLKQYGGKLYPGDKNNYDGYGLTGADVKTLTGIVTYIPPAAAN